VGGEKSSGHGERPSSVAGKVTKSSVHTKS